MKTKYEIIEDGKTWRADANITTRDYFAAKALAGWIASSDTTGTPGDAAKYAYQCADAMLMEREKETPQ